MKKIIVLFGLLLPLCLVAQKNNVTLEDINKKYTFYPNIIKGVRSMHDGVNYTVLENKSTRINKYSYQTGNKVKTLLDLSEIKECPVKHIQGYQLNNSETEILLYTNREKIYRRSFKADYYIYDIKRKKIKKLTEKGKVQQATFSPNGNMISFVYKNDIYIAKIRFGVETRVTNDGEYNKVINGLPDWVYEEEFSMNRAMEWSPNSEELAFVKFNESKVRQFSFPFYKANYPENKGRDIYPEQYKFKYPKPGEDNSVVSVNVFNIKNRTTKVMQTGDDKDLYIPRIRWTYNPGKLGILTLNRNQNTFNLLIANTSSTVANSIFTHRSKYYIAEAVLDNLTFLPDAKHFIYVGEMDGYNHIFLYTMAGREVRQITKGKFDVTDFYGFDSKKQIIYYQAAKNNAMQREIYATRLDGKKTYKLSTKKGTNNALFSSNFKYYINYFSSVKTPMLITLHNQSGKLIRTLEDNSNLAKLVKEYNISPKEFFTFKTKDGTELNGWMVKPINFDENTEYPLLIVQYSGPNSQQVLDKWRIGWEQYLATQGFVVACIDPRGTGARGEEFRKCTYMRLGKQESDDMIEAAEYLGGLNFIDNSRMGIWGWSYGGFMTLSCLSKGNGIFKVGIAVAPVTNWRFYDTIYTERYMRTPQENGKRYDENSPIFMADKLQGKLLLIHGTADDNVHFQNSTEYISALIKADKQFDMFIYPNKNHSIYGGNTRMHLYKMMSDYLKNNL